MAHEFVKNFFILFASALALFLASPEHKLIFNFQSFYFLSPGAAVWRTGALTRLAAATASSACALPDSSSLKRLSFWKHKNLINDAKYRKKQMLPVGALRPQVPTRPSP